MQTEKTEHMHVNKEGNEYIGEREREIVCDIYNFTRLISSKFDGRSTSIKWGSTYIFRHVHDIEIKFVILLQTRNINIDLYSYVLLIYFLIDENGI